MNGRSEKFFNNPLEFKPERFLKTEDNSTGFFYFLLIDNIFAHIIKFFILL